MFNFYKNRKRYFIVFYTGQAQGGNGQSIGYASLWKNGFLKQESLINSIAEVSGIEKPVITGLVEINKSEYETWNRKENENS